MNAQQNNRLRVFYYFTEPEWTSCADYPAQGILEKISKSGNGLRLFRTEGLWKQGMHESKSFVYRLSSSEEGAQIDFILRDNVVQVLMLIISPTLQGSFFRLKRFLIHKVSKVLFDCGYTSIEGAAVVNDHAIRRHPLKKHKDFRLQKAKYGINKLVKLYLLMGFERQGEGDSIILELTLEGFDKVIKKKVSA